VTNHECGKAGLRIRQTEHTCNTNIP
jgi:hypothetical protein